MSTKRPAAPAPPPPPPPLVAESWRPSRIHVVVMLGMVAVVTAIFEWAMTAAPIPPGSDPGDWIQRSYAFVGLAHPPVLAVGSPFLYPPLIFPIIGGIYLVTGTATATGFVIAGVLLAGYGLSVVHLARRFFATGPVQVLFVGLVLFNGTTLSMLFWGAYPNFLAFILFNEAIIAFAAYVARERFRDGILLCALLALVYLTHALTFDLLLLALAGGFFLLLVARRARVRLLLARTTLLGAGLLVGVIAGYTAAVRYFGIATPNYISANPAAYVIDNLGELFVPLANAPSIFVSGRPLVLAPWVVMVLLASVAAALVLVSTVAPRRWSRWSPNALLIAEGWLAAALVTPLLGWIGHVDTDYPRFLYFLPLPGFLAVGLAIEQLLLRARWATSDDPAPWSPATSVSGAPIRSPRRPRPTGTVAIAGVLAIVAVLAGNVAVPTIFLNEKLNSGTSHNAYFVDAEAWLKANPRAGSVLTVNQAIRWTEALTTRGGYDVGPTWLLFAPWQVMDTEESYWALNSREALTNNFAVLSYSGFGSALLSQAPMYSVMDEGVTVSLLRLLPGASFVTSSVANASFVEGLTQFSTPTLIVPGPAAISAVTTYVGPHFQVVQTATLAPTRGEAWINYTVTGQAGAALRHLGITLADPPRLVSQMHTGSPPAIAITGGTLEWNVSTILGRLPGAQPINTTVSLVPAPSAAAVTSSPTGTAVGLIFDPPAGPAPLQVSVHLSTSPTSNPAVVLPPYLDTATFLGDHDIHFLLLPNDPSSGQTIAYYEATYHFQLGYANPDWVILEG
ncbi:MAG: hypothetical protein L3K15_04835 [Thermoplasmata archaeon]|nr:hypothetical protein [Thermoplasmata archaeon]